MQKLTCVSVKAKSGDVNVGVTMSLCLCVQESAP